MDEQGDQAGAATPDAANDAARPAPLGRRLGDRLADHAPMIVLTVFVVWASVGLHRNGLSWGDDWALYVRQARSLYEGNIGQVIADNHFNVDNAARPGFSPYVYPWGFPILLAPVLRLVGHDYERLRYVGVASLVVFLWAFHAVVRARLQKWAAFAVVACVGTTLVYLDHTGFILSELPYMASVAVSLWLLDRARRAGPLQLATRAQLIGLGVAAVWVFNVRREGIALIVAIVVAQLVDLWPARREWRSLDRWKVATPVVTFLAGVALFQLLLPSALFPEYEDAGLHQTWRKLQGPFRVDFADQLGMPAMTGHLQLRGVLLWGIFLLAVAGMLWRIVRAPRWDAPLATFAVLSMIAVGTIPAVSPRYLMAITPFAVYFAAQALASLPLPRRAGGWLAAAAVGLLVLVHVSDVPKVIDQVQAFDDAGFVQPGPDTPSNAEALDAVRRFTHQDDVVAFFKVRALTLLTGRRGIQSSDFDILQQRADYYLMQREPTGGWPFVATPDADALGWTKVWENDDWVLWRLPQRDGG